MCGGNLGHIALQAAEARRVGAIGRAEKIACESCSCLGTGQLGRMRMGQFGVQAELVACKNMSSAAILRNR